MAKATNIGIPQLVWLTSEEQPIAKLLLNRLLILYLLFSQQYFLAAQNQHQPYFRNYSTNEGLSSPEVHDIIQDQNGYLWIATDNGVCRYDGYTFTNFGAKEGLRNNVIFHLREDQEGKIWMQSMTGNMYYYCQDSIYAYPYNHLIVAYRNYFDIADGFLLLADGTLYSSLYGLGIMKISPDGEDQIINLYNLPFNFVIIQEAPPGQRYLFSSAVRKNLKRLGWDLTHLDNSTSCGIYQDTVLKQIMPLASNLSEKFKKVYAYADEAVTLVDIRSQLNVFENYQQQTVFDLPASVSEITRVDNSFWVGFNNRKGVRLYPDKAALIANDYRTLLDGRSVSAICPDRSGGFWFGTLNDGIYFAPDLELQILYQEPPESNANIISLEKWRDDKLVFGTDDGRVQAVDQRGNVEQLYRAAASVFDLWYDERTEELWIASVPLTIRKQEQILKTGISIPPELDMPNWLIEKKLVPTSDGRFLFGSNGYGLDLFDIEKKALVYSTFYSPIKERFLDVHQDLAGNWWVGKTDGLFQLKDSILHRPALPHSLFELRVEDIDQLADSSLVIATKGGGIAIWKGDRVEVINKNNGLSANMIEHIKVDTLQQIWVGTLNGLNKVYRSPRQDGWLVKSMTTAFGLPSNEINDLCQMGDWMFVATSRGIARLPLVDTSKAGFSNVLLEKVLVNGLQRDLKDLQSLEFKENNLQLQFLCINLKLDWDINYRYRLNPQGGWSVTSSRIVDYAALSPGDYNFEVQAQNEDGVWSESLAISFSIAQPFWQRWWFIVLSVAGLVGLVYYWYRLRLARLQKEANIEREINELQRSALQAQMNPHFIFNSLNSIQNFIASGNKTSAMEYLSRFATLVRRTLNASVEPFITLQDEVQVLEDYLELEKLRFGHRFNYTIRVDQQLDTFDTLLPPLMVQPFVENAILHGFNFKDPTRIGELFIAYEKIDGFLQITIRDNGIGITNSKLSKDGKEKLRTSLGMNITRKRLSLQNQHKDIEQLQVRELVAADGQAAGTEIVIRIRV